MNIDREIRLYLKHIKLLLPAYSRPERKYLADLKNRIQDIVQEHPDISIKGIEDLLGTPLEISQSYIASLDPDVLLKRLSATRIIKRIFILLIICAIILVSVFTSFLYKAYLDSKNTVITNTETVITD